jgi:hypothetical protein
MRHAWIVMFTSAFCCSRVLAQPSGVVPASATSLVPTVQPVEFQKLPAHKQQVYLAARRAMDYLLRNQAVDGRFVYGYHPALRVEMEGDNFLSQARATYALGRAARYFQNADAAAAAKQSLLKLLDATSVDDPKMPRSRHTSAPDAFLNRLEAGGTLLLALHEVPSPQADLLDAGDQLAHDLRTRWPAEGKQASENGAGAALQGLMHSQAQRPAAWKVECARTHCAAALPAWKQARSPYIIPSHTAAYATAFAHSHEPQFSNAVFELNDWLCTLQYEQSADPRRALWTGGFMTFVDGKSVAAAPNANSAVYAESLVDACRTARLAGDLQRYRRYKEALESSLAFLLRLQYTEARVSHFAAWHQPRVLGAFHGSATDGDIRLDYLHHALPALVGYLRDVPDE